MAAPGKRCRHNNICAAPPTPKITAPLSLASDLMLEVMARTDFVTLVRCAAICKHLRRDILSAPFIRRLARQPALSILAYLSRYEDQPLILVHPVTPAAESFCYGHLSPFMSRRIGNVLGQYCPLTSRGGLVVLHRLRVKMQPPMYMHLFDLCVYDPMTGHPTFVPKSPDVLTDVSFAQEYVLLTTADGIGYSFMLLIIDIGMSSINVHTITSSSGIWTTVTCANHCKFPWRSISRYSDPVILLGGVVHWLVDHGNQILTYDVGTRMQGLVKLPPTNRNASQLHLATSPDGKQLKLLAIDGFLISTWLQLPTVPADGGDWALQTVIDIEEKLRPLIPDLPIGGGPDILVGFKASGKRSGDVVLLHVHSRGCVVLDLETKQIHMQKCGSMLLEIDLPSHLQSMKVFS